MEPKNSQLKVKKIKKSFFFRSQHFVYLLSSYISSTLVNITLKTLLFSILKHYFSKNNKKHLFPNFSPNTVNCPNPKGPGPIPKMVKIPH